MQQFAITRLNRGEQPTSHSEHLKRTFPLGPTFESLSSYNIDGIPCFAVSNLHECQDFKHLMGEVVSVDGKQYEVSRVEAYAHNPPYKKGETIGLVVSPV